MKITKIKEFKELLLNDKHLDNSIKLSFASSYEHASQNSINTANDVAADYVYDDLISDAFTEGIVFEIDENELKSFLIDQYGFTIAFVQSGF